MCCRPTEVDSARTVFLLLHSKYNFIVSKEGFSRMYVRWKLTWFVGISGPRTTLEFCDASFLKFKSASLIWSLIHRKDDPNNGVFISMEGNGYGSLLLMEREAQKTWLSGNSGSISLVKMVSMMSVLFLSFWTSCITREDVFECAPLIWAFHHNSDPKRWNFLFKKESSSSLVT